MYLRTSTFSITARNRRPTILSWHYLKGSTSQASHGAIPSTLFPPSTYYIPCAIPSSLSSKFHKLPRPPIPIWTGEDEIQQPSIRGRKQVSLNCSCTIPNLPKLSLKLELVCPPSLSSLPNLSRLSSISIRKTNEQVKRV
jgi:hypothetical protein